MTAVSEAERREGFAGVMPGSPSSRPYRRPVLVLTWLIAVGPPSLAVAQPRGNTLFLNGSVVQENGAPPDRQLMVELVCGDLVQQQVRTSEKGFFSFSHVMNQPEGWTDASVGRDVEKPGVFGESNFQTFNMSACRIRLVSGQGFSANSIQLGHRSAFDSPEVGLLVLVPGEEANPAIVSLTSLRAPAAARNSYEKAMAELAKKKPDPAKAIRDLKTAVKEFPEFAEAWYQMGELLTQQKKHEEAQHAYDQAVTADPGFVKPYLALARQALFSEQWQQASDLSDKALSLTPQEEKAYYYKGLANYYLGRAKPAEEGLRFVVDHGFAATYPLSCFHLGVIYAQAGRIQEAGEQFNQYLRLMPEQQVDPAQRERIRQQLTDWKSKGLWKDDTHPSPPSAAHPK